MASDQPPLVDWRAAGRAFLYTALGFLLAGALGLTAGLLLHGVTA